MEIKAINGVAVLFYFSRGVSFEQVFYLSIVWAVVSVLTEFPTGYLADRWGRARLLMLGALIYALSLGLAFFAQGFSMFVIQYVLLAIAFACASGAEDALVYDTLKALDNEKEANLWNGRVAAARQIGKIFIPSIGAFIAQYGRFEILVGIDFVASIMAVGVLTHLVEPPRVTSLLETEETALQAILKVLKTNRRFRSLVGNQVFIFAAFFLILRAYQPLLIENGFSIWFLGLWYGAYHLTLVFVYTHLQRLVARFTFSRIANGTIMFGLFGLALCILSPYPWGVALGAWMALLGTGMREPFFSAPLNEEFPSFRRATVLSQVGFFKSVANIPVLLIAGWLASRYGTPAVMGLAFLICFGTLLTFWVPTSVKIRLTC